MKYYILFPSDYFDFKKVEEDYRAEYETVKKFPEFNIVFYNYDRFIQGERIKIYPYNREEGICIYRGWMLKPEKYKIFYEELKKQGLVLLNNPIEYNYCHMFPCCYERLKEDTPKTIWFSKEEEIDWKRINQISERFFIKDYVKSVKGFDFPKYYQSPVEEEKMKREIKKLIGIRGELYTGGIVIKEYVDLKRYGECINEYRVFYLKNKILTISKNSNQTDKANQVPIEFVKKFADLDSNFYTIDFAELKNGEWIIIETGDGQVSGLSPNQYVFKYYDEMRRILEL